MRAPCASFRARGSGKTVCSHACKFTASVFTGGITFGSHSLALVLGMTLVFVKYVVVCCDGDCCDVMVSKESKLETLEFGERIVCDCYSKKIWSISPVNHIKRAVETSPQAVDHMTGRKLMNHLVEYVAHFSQNDDEGSTKRQSHCKLRELCKQVKLPLCYLLVGGLSSRVYF
jgi:hypothetical protein